MTNYTKILLNLKRSLFIFLLFGAAVSLFFSQLAYAQISEFKITAADGAAGYRFGCFVSISGDYAIVGAYRNDENGIDAGAAYVFKRTDITWEQEAKLLASDGLTGDRFGFSAVAISGDYAVVGAHVHNDNGISSGAAYVFKRTDTTWAEEAKLLASDGATSDIFGLSVSISGDYIIVGAGSAENDNFLHAGAAYVFKRTDTTWAEEAKLLASDGESGDALGISVFISGDYAVVGAFHDDDNGDNSGSAYVFMRSGTTWVEEAKLLPSDGEAQDNFGKSVAISGDYAVVGASGDDDNGLEAGAAYVFKRTDTTWAEEAKLLPSDGAEGDLSGLLSVSISGDYAVVSAHGHDDNGFESGAVYVFKRTDTTWAEEVKLLASDGAAFDNFGRSVSISGDFLLIGAQSNAENGFNSGSAYIFDKNPPVGVIDGPTNIATEFSLDQNYPNPFNPKTVIEYTLPIRSEVRLIIYNLRGQEVALLINGNMPIGNHQVIWNASKFPSGIYFYRLQAGDFVLTRKMVLLK